MVDDPQKAARPTDQQRRPDGKGVPALARPAHDVDVPVPSRSSGPSWPVRTPMGPQFGGGSTASRAPWRVPSGIFQSGIAADAARVGDLEIRAASIVGPGHRCEDPAKPRQDAYLVTRSRRGDFAVICVADGVSASRDSEVGARVAVNAAARELLAALDKNGDHTQLDAELIFRRVAGEMVGTAKSRASAPEDYQAVLLLVVVPTRQGEDRLRSVWTAQLGDLSLWRVAGAGLEQLTGGAKAGLDRNDLSAVLPHHPHQVNVQLIAVRPTAVLAAVTDGVGDMFTDISGAAEYFANRWTAPRSPSEMVNDLSFDAPGQQDDRTAVVVWCGAKATDSVGSR